MKHVASILNKGKGEILMVERVKREDPVEDSEEQQDRSSLRKIKKYIPYRGEWLSCYDIDDGKFQRYMHWKACSVSCSKKNKCRSWELFSSEVYDGMMPIIRVRRFAWETSPRKKENGYDDQRAIEEKEQGLLDDTFGLATVAVPAIEEVCG
jgi:hypothetical protein